MVKLKWKTDLPYESALSKPIIIGGDVLFSAHAEFFSLNKKTGFINWKYKKKKKPIIYSFIANDNYIYIGSGDGCLNCLDIKTGKEVWVFKIPKIKDEEHHYYYQASITDALSINMENIYFTAGKTLYAVDINSGIESWQLTSNSELESTFIFDNKLYCFYDTDIYSTDLDNPKLIYLGRSYGETIDPLVIEQSTIYAGNAGSGYGVAAIDRATGNEKWYFDDLNDDVLGLALNNNRLFFGSRDYNLYAIDTGTGKLDWKFETNGAIDCHINIKNDTLYFGNHDGTLYALDTLTGKEEWKYKTENWITGGSVESDGVIYFGNDGGSIFAIYI